MRAEYKWLIGCAAGIILLCLCTFAVVLAGGGLYFLSQAQEVAEPVDFPPTRTPAAQAPQRIPTLPAATQAPDREQEPPGRGEEVDPPQAIGEGAMETLKTLQDSLIPINDPIELARRLRGVADIPDTLDTVPPLLKVGEEKTFWVTDLDTNQNKEVQATLQYVTDHLYFWIQNGVAYHPSDLKRLAETFENEIYPTTRAFFGSEWSPGVDNDPRLYVLYARGLGSTVAGYFSSVDSLHPLAHPYSNAHETFLLSADNVFLGEDYVYSTMAHELQHMIHWNQDRNEETWMNEGFSVLAELLNNFDSGGFDTLYVEDPDLQLTVWPSSPNSAPHYGASFLFLAYFLDRFGDDVTRAVVGHPDNGMVSIDAVFSELGIADPTSGEIIQADDFFADWVVTTYLNDESVGDGRYVYRRYSQAPQAWNTEEVRQCSPDTRSRTVKQYGVDYIYIKCAGSFTLELEGNTEVAVLPEDAFSGVYAYWSNKGDESNMTLTRTFDFEDVSGPIVLSYNTWFDLETDYDYLYLVASEDGENWEILKTPSGTDYNPSGNSYGWGYNGQTSGWIEENVDLTQYAGKQVMLQFEYVTDAAVNGEGLLLDDVRVDAINYSEDFEDGDGGWEAQGFVRIQNRLPQTFKISLITNEATTLVQQFTMQPGEKLSIPLDFGSELKDAVVVISGVTRFTTQPANYQYRFK